MELYFENELIKDRFLQLWSSWKIFSSANEKSKCYYYLELNFTMVYTRREYLQLRIRWKIWWRIDEMILFCYVTWNSIPGRNARANKLRTILVGKLLWCFPMFGRGIGPIKRVKAPREAMTNCTRQSDTLLGIARRQANFVFDKLNRIHLWQTWPL